MKHYKLRCSVSVPDYTTSNVFVEIYCKGKSYVNALCDGMDALTRDYPFDLDFFDNINMSFEWEDENENNRLINESKSDDETIN